MFTKFFSITCKHTGLKNEVKYKSNVKTTVVWKIKVNKPTFDKISEKFPRWTVGRFENLRCLRKGLCRKCDIWLTIDNNLGLANALSL